LQISNATHLANLTPSTLFVGNSSSNILISTLSVSVNGSSIVNTTGVYTTTVNAASYTVGTSTVANATGVYTGVVNGSVLQVGTSTVANSTGVYTGVVNATSHTTTGVTANVTGVYPTSNTSGSSLGLAANRWIVFANTIDSSGLITGSSGATITGTTNTSVEFNVGSSFKANTTGVYAGVVNGSVLQVGTSTIANSTGVYTGVVNAASYTVGTSFTANATLVNASAINITNQTNTATLFVTTSANVGVNVQVTTQGLNITGNTTTQPTLNLVSNSVASGLFIGNNTVTGAPQLMVANSAGNTTINATSIGSSWGFSVNSTATVIPGTLTAAVNASSISLGNSTVNTVVNSTSISTGNSTVNTFINSTAISVNGSLSVQRTASISGNTTLSGNWANVTSDLFVRGNLIVNGSVTYTGNATGDIIPVSNNYSLGNTSNRWNLYAVQIDNIGNTISNNVIVTNVVNSASFTVGTSSVINSTGVWTTGTTNSAIVQTGNGYNVAGNGIYANATLIWIGNNSVSTTVNSTVFSGTSNNTSFVGSVSAANVVSNAQLSANLANYAALAGGATFVGSVSVSNNVTITGNLIVTGTTLYANVTNLDVKDLNITVAKGVASAAAADGAGITVDTANVGWYYHNSSNTWQSNVGITPSANNTLNLGTTTLRWANVNANNVVASNLYGTVLTATQGTIDHNSLANYDANKHIDHTTVSISTANGVAGGGTIAATRSLYVVSNNGIVANSTGVWAAAANGISVTAAGINVLGNTGIVSNSSGVFANSSYIQSLVNVSNGSVVTSGTSAQSIDNFAIASYMGAEYLISVSDNSANNKYLSKAHVMHDGSIAQITEYGAITSNNSVGVFSATQNTTHIILQFTPSLTATTVKFTRMVV
jgi:hypothetical protein